MSKKNAETARMIRNCYRINERLNLLAAEAQTATRARDYRTTARIYRNMVRLGKLGTRYEAIMGVSFDTIYRANLAQ